MRTLTVTSMRIQPDVYRLIEQGVKTHEVRDETFNPDIIIYRSASDDVVLGVWQTVPDSMQAFGRDRDDETIRLASISRSLFYELFPDQPILYSVALDRETTWRQVESELFGEDQSL